VSRPEGDATTIVAAVARIESAVQAGDSHALSELLAADKRFEFNRSRQAIQAIGCQDAVVATVSLDGSIARALAEN
jgi:hypothetical protein